MEVEILDGKTISVSGQPKAQRHYDVFKEAYKTVESYGEAPHIVFENATLLTSTFIGFIVLCHNKGCQFTIEAKNEKLKQFMESIHLTEIVKEHSNQ